MLLLQFVCRFSYLFNIYSLLLRRQNELQARVLFCLVMKQQNSLFIKKLKLKTMANLNGNNLMESMLETQKSMVDKMVENTKKLANGNTLVSETINKGSEWYKNWLENQKKAMSATAEKAQEMGGNVQEQAGKMNDFYQNWQNGQNNFAKQMWDMNQNWFKSTMQQTANPMENNPMAQFQNWMNQANNWMSAMGQQQHFMNNMQDWTKGFTQFNPFNMEQMKNSGDNVTNLFNQYFEMLNYNFATLQKTMQSTTAQDAFRNMMNVNDGFVRFYEMWSPMLKSIQDKTFSMDKYKQMIDPSQYKEVMDKFFGFMPEHTNQYFQNFGKLMQDGMKQFGQSGFGGYHQMKSMMGNMMPGFNPAQMFEGMNNGYHTFQNSLNGIFAPMAKMITPNDYTKSMAEWSEIADKMVVYNIKNAEMQYMIYAQGSQVMDKVAASVVNKLENGEEVNSVMALYQEWLNISDKEFVALFESDEYAKVMADTASLQMRLRKDIEQLLEKQLVNIPVATRSEIEELYKTIYDLKKQVRQLEKMMEMETEEETTKESEMTPAAKKTAAKKK